MPETTQQSGPSHRLTPEELCGVIQHRYEYSRLLKELVDQQAELIASQQYSSLVDLLSRKQSLVEALHGWSDCQPPLGEEWRRQRNQLSGDRRAQCEILLKQTEENLERVMEREAADTSLLENQMEENRSQLQFVSGGVAAADAYQDDSAGSHFDRNF